jgi:ribosomal protein S18 acetylase RimI-like enzyme
MASVRRARRADIPAIVAIVNAAFQIESGFRAGERTSSPEISRLMRSRVFFVAVEGGRIAGAVQVRVTGATGYFSMLAVDPKLQQSGIGRALRESAESYCRQQGCREMTLSTGSPRRELLAYYRKAGYEITTVEPAPPDATFTKRMDIVTMAKVL